ncbi:Sensor protein FixL [Zhongshania aliphaticivorans]|uniref:Sensor protein FixL n=1 Tax=Zhongshania aliphaticivorans TaxID=1470434 RepID=A0A5S9NX72_9GAMM|nr:PAS domain-containing sensor histidine kinase [Zhongshania aliphaticivorans]CAA0095290.1 Sensor protein FixL [Zhongshania aliphaticivorans]CAA0113107.1 Sensor protein FixL [Zhongshania aliphaticivorans]
MSDREAINDLLSRTKAILDTIVDGVITINDQGLIETVNPAAENIFGYNKSELIGNNVSMLMPLPYHKEHDIYLSNYLDTGDKKIIGIGREVTGLRSNGTTFPLELAISEMEVNGQRMFTGVVRDISQRKNTEETLRGLLARTKAILDTIVDGVITISDKGLIETVNPAAENIFGYTVDELAGKNVSLLMPNPYRAEHDQYLINYLNTGEKKIIGIGREVTGLRKNGESFPLELAISEMEVNGQRMFTGIVRDISERKETEEKLRTAMRRVHEQQIKDEFIATVSHELRTPLTSIKASLELMIGGAIDNSSKQADMLINIAHKNSDRLLLLINDILDISKIESEKIPFNRQIISVKPFLETAIFDNQAYAEKHHVKFTLTHCPELVFINADPDRLMQVMSNLMSNAAKFSHHNSVVEINARIIENKIRIAVCDTGIGISPDFQGRVFEKFTQADTSDKREMSGTGLGLHISKAIVEQHQGTLAFESSIDKGSEFYIELELIQPDIPQGFQHE